MPQQEYFADYWALDSCLVSLENPASSLVGCKTWDSQARACVIPRPVNTATETRLFRRSGRTTGPSRALQQCC